MPQISTDFITCAPGGRSLSWIQNDSWSMCGLVFCCCPGRRGTVQAKLRHLHTLPLPHPSYPTCLLTFERREKELILNKDTPPHGGNSISNTLCHQIRHITLAPVSLQSLHLSAWLFTVRGHSYHTPFPTRVLPSGWRSQASLWSLGSPRTRHSLHARVYPNSPHSGWNFGQNQSNNVNVKCTKWALAKIGSNHKACSEYVRIRWQKSLNIWRKSVSGPYGEKRTNRTYHENILLWFGNSLYFELILRTHTLSEQY